MARLGSETCCWVCPGAGAMAEGQLGSAMARGWRVIEVFDLTDRESFTAALKRAEDLFRRGGEDPAHIVLLVGNKLDLVEEGMKPRQVEKSEAESAAAGLEVPYIETSAKTGHGVVETFLLAWPHKEK